MAEALKDAAYAVDWVTDGQTATDATDRRALRSGAARSRPAQAGRARRAAALRTAAPLPVIIVTARDGIEDRSGPRSRRRRLSGQALRHRELLARMRAILRRQGSGGPADAEQRRGQPGSATTSGSHEGSVSRSRRASSPCCRRCCRARARSCHARISSSGSMAGTRKWRATPSIS